MGDGLALHDRADFEYVHSRAIAYARKELKLTPSDAEEMVDQALFRAHARKSGYIAQPGVTYLAWILRVVVNLVIDEHRHRRRTERLQELASECLEPSGVPAPDAALSDKQAERTRLLLIEALPTDMRHILGVWLEQHAGRISRADAAARLGCSVAKYEAAKKRVGRELGKTMMRLRIRADHLWSGTTERRAAGSHRIAGQEDET